MAGRQGYGVKSPEAYKSCGRFRKGVRYPEREGTWPPKGVWGNPKAKPLDEQARKLKMKEEKRREAIRLSARDIQETAREYTEQALRVLADVMNNDQEAGPARIQAAQALLDRGHGKPTITQVNANLNADVKPSEIDATDLDKRIANALNRIEKLAGREIKTIEAEVLPDRRDYN